MVCTKMMFALQFVYSMLGNGIKIQKLDIFTIKKNNYPQKTNN